MSTFCVFLLIEPPIDGFPGTHRQPLANPFERHGRFPPQLPRHSDLHRITLAPAGQKAQRGDPQPMKNLTTDFADGTDKKKTGSASVKSVKSVVKIFPNMNDSDGLQCKIKTFCGFCAFSRLFRSVVNPEV
jgi:hypothetical protein